MTDDARTAMLAAIGGVAMNSAHASMALQQVAETVTGTGLVNFTLRDQTLGGQVNQVKTWVEYAGTNEWISHPPIHAGTRDVILSTLGALSSTLVPLRNRVIHDVWEPKPTAELPDAIHGSAAARWGRKADVDTTVGTLWIIANTMFLVACALGAAGRALEDRRDDGDDKARTHNMAEMERYDRELTARLAAIRAGTHKGWHWPPA